MVAGLDVTSFQSTAAAASPSRVAANVQGARFVFGSGGSLTIQLGPSAHVAQGLGTLRGSYSADGRFSASARTSSGVGVQQLVIEGIVSPGGSATATYQAGQAVGASVNGIGFGAGSTTVARLSFALG